MAGSDFLRTIVGMMAGETGVWVIEPRRMFNDADLTELIRTSEPGVYGPVGRDRFQFMRRNKRGKWVFLWVED